MWFLGHAEQGLPLTDPETLRKVTGKERTWAVREPAGGQRSLRRKTAKGHLGPASRWDAT